MMMMMDLSLSIGNNNGVVMLAIAIRDTRGYRKGRV